MRSTLLLVEDDLRLAEIMVEYLSEAYRPTHCPDGESALQAALDGPFDVMIVDRRLPGMDGVTLVKRLRRARVWTPIIMLTALGTVPDRVSGLDAGANDYLIKPFDFDELSARLRALLRTPDASSPVRIGSWSFYPDERILQSPYSGPVVLTPRENDLLTLFATNPDTTFTRDQVLRAVFSAADQPSSVDTYVHYLRRKTEDSVIVTVRGRGYRLGTL